MSDQRFATAYALALETFDNETLAAFNLIVQMSDRVPTQNISYQPAVKAGIIKENGYVHDLEALRDACAYEVKRRVEAGTFKI